MVIFGHSFGLVQDPGYPIGTWDPNRFLHYDGVYSASVAVKVFFFISGLLITNSLLEKRSVGDFIVARCCWIFPALLVVLLLSAFVIGPFYSTLELPEYLAHPKVYQYVGANLLLLGQGSLPGGVHGQSFAPTRQWSLVVPVL